MIQRARAGDPDAFAEIWSDHHHLVLRYFRSRRMDDPEDLASTVWIDVAESLHRFRGDDDDLRRWILTIAARRRVDEIRRVRRRRDHHADEAHATAASATVLTEDASDAVERRAALDRTAAMVATLPGDQAEAVMLRVVADLSTSDAATIMGKRQGAVRVLVHRGLRRLEHTVSGGHRDAADDPPSVPLTLDTPRVTLAGQGYRRG